MPHQVECHFLWVTGCLSVVSNRNLTSIKIYINICETHIPLKNQIHSFIFIQSKKIILNTILYGGNVFMTFKIFSGLVY